MPREPYVYILTNRPHGCLYTGVTSCLPGRVYQHKCKLVQGFCAQYNIDKLVYYEQHGSIYEAIQREKRIKKWRRAWKVELIEEVNPLWKDLYWEICN